MSYNNCNFEIQDEIINENRCIDCPFCLKGIENYVNNFRGEPCGYKMEMIFYNDKQVCNGCGLGHGYKNASKYIGYHENGYKIQKKSIYQKNMQNP